MARCPASTSMVVAPMRLANSRSASGGMAWSPVATRNQDGSDFQAGVPITSTHDAHGEVRDEVVLRQPDEAVGVGEQVLQRRRGGPLGQQAAERLSFVDPEP